MPLLGYLGYVPFALELFALYHLAIGMLGSRGNSEFIQIATPATPFAEHSVQNP